mmetsp:Transcript_2295/g.6328  ORF Transcript_2295/g.6328 Transcript_2295/m.6328 type:complete len:276 (-) Transcript_2295:218-1045(-)
MRGDPGLIRVLAHALGARPKIPYLVLVAHDVDVIRFHVHVRQAARVHVVERLQTAPKHPVELFLVEGLALLRVIREAAVRELQLDVEPRVLDPACVVREQARVRSKGAVRLNLLQGLCDVGVGRAQVLLHVLDGVLGSVEPVDAPEDCAERPVPELLHLLEVTPVPPVVHPADGREHLPLPPFPLGVPAPLPLHQLGLIKDVLPLPLLRVLLVVRFHQQVLLLHVARDVRELALEGVLYTQGRLGDRLDALEAASLHPGPRGPVPVELLGVRLKL